MACRAVLCSATLCFATMSCAMQCCARLCFATMCCAMLCCAVLCSAVPRCTLPLCAVLCCAVPRYATPGAQCACLEGAACFHGAVPSCATEQSVCVQGAACPSCGLCHAMPWCSTHDQGGCQLCLVTYPSYGDTQHPTALPWDGEVLSPSIPSAMWRGCASPMHVGHTSHCSGTLEGGLWLGTAQAATHPPVPSATCRAFGGMSWAPT